MNVKSHASPTTVLTDAPPNKSDKLSKSDSKVSTSDTNFGRKARRIRSVEPLHIAESDFNYSVESVQYQNYENYMALKVMCLVKIAT